MSGPSRQPILTDAIAFDDVATSSRPAAANDEPRQGRASAVAVSTGRAHCTGRSSNPVSPRANNFGFAFVAFALAIPHVARAGASDTAKPSAAAEPRPAAPKTDLSVVPLVGGSSDFGFGGGLLGAVSRNRTPGPYVYRIEVASMTTFRPDPNGDIGIPYWDSYFLLTVPRALDGRLRLEVRPSFTREGRLKYSGIGNASPPPMFGGEAQRRYEYGRVHPTLIVRGRLALGAHFFLLEGISATYNELTIAPDSVVARDAASERPEVRRAFATVAPHGVVLFEHALEYDSRDDETTPSRGQYHTVKLRLSPGGSAVLPYRYGQANLTLRGYTSPTEAITLAARFVFDWQFGDVPFYELARYEDTYAIGGGKGVRGVLAQRYYGKVKAFGNLEARADFVDFRLFKKTMTFGAAAFFDAGRLFSTLPPDPALDGTGLGLKWGVGAGPRIRAGKAFVIRADVAWSPDAHPLGIYFLANHIF